MIFIYGLRVAVVVIAFVSFSLMPACVAAFFSFFSILCRPNLFVFTMPAIDLAGVWHNGNAQATLFFRLRLDFFLSVLFLFSFHFWVVKWHYCLARFVSERPLLHLICKYMRAFDAGDVWEQAAISVAHFYWAAAAIYENSVIISGWATSLQFTSIK